MDGWRQPQQETEEKEDQEREDKKKEKKKDKEGDERKGRCRRRRKEVAIRKERDSGEEHPEAQAGWIKRTATGRLHVRVSMYMYT